VLQPYIRPIPALLGVWFAPNEKHWHGATPTSAMTHLAIQEALNGKVVEWLEHGTNKQYRK
jgi:hypothetical protein